MKLKIKKYFIIIASVSITVLAVLFFFLYHAHNEAILLAKDQFNEQQVLVGKQTALGIEENIRLLARELELLSLTPEIKDFDLPKARNIMNDTFKYVKDFYVNDIGLIDSRGIVRLPLHAPQLTGTDFSFRKYFKEAKKLSASTPTYEFITFKGVEKGLKGIVIAMPIFTEKREFGGVILFTIKVNDLIAGFIPSQGSSSEFWVIDEGGHFLSHPRYKPGTLIHELPDLDISFRSFIENVRSVSTCITGCVSPEGDRVVIASYPLKIANQTWSIIISSPEKILSRLLVRFNVKYSVGALLAFLAIIGGSFTAIYMIQRWNIELESTIRLRTKELEISEAKVRELIETVNDWIWEVDTEGKYVYASPRVKDILGYDPHELIGKTPFSLMPPGEAEKIRAAFEEIAAGGKPFDSLENINIHKNGGTVVLETSGVPVLDHEGRLMGYRGVDRDITERKKAEEKLKASLNEKELLLREIHHRVKNNMQIISSLLRHQMVSMKDREEIDIFRDSQDRINSMALIHEQLYQSNNLMNINFSEYVKHLVNGLFQTYGVAAGKVASKIIINDISLGVDTAIPCGLVINELVSNSLKHAFPEGREGVIEISIKKSKDSDADDHDFKLTVKDNGAGIPENIDIRETRSLGLQLVTILAEHQLRGKIEIGRSDGTEFNIFFNELKYKKRI
jgi:PAS domain S-box-containing protein